MKKKLLFVAVAAIGILVSGCKTEVTPIFPESESGTLSVTIKSETHLKSLAIVTGETPTQEEENTVHSFTVYVFDYATGAFEKKETINGLTGEITGLNTVSEKRVVVLVNAPEEVSITKYEELQDHVININSQDVTDFKTSGLFMSGEAPEKVKLSIIKKTSVEIEVKRLVAKIILGSLTIHTDAAPELADFNLEGVSIQKTRNLAYALGGKEKEDSNFVWIGGIEGSVSETQAESMYEKYEFPSDSEKGEPSNPNIYFYVYENNDAINPATTLVLVGTYEKEGGKPVKMYYPFQVNTVKVEGDDESNPDGTRIKRNMSYTLNVTLKDLGLLTDDPDAITDAELDVTLEVSDWDGNLIQNEKR